MTKIIALAVIISLAVGLGLGFYIGYKNASLKFTSQIEKIKMLFPSSPDTRSISGTVKSVSGNVVTLETTASPNPFEELPTVRQVTVGSGTKIIKQVTKDPAEFQKEVTAWQKSSTDPKSGTITTLPLPFAETELKVSQLKSGDRVSVEASNNIKTQVSFEATKITVLGQGGFPGSGAGPGPGGLPSVPGSGAPLPTPPPISGGALPIPPGAPLPTPPHSSGGSITPPPAPGGPRAAPPGATSPLPTPPGTP